MVAQDAVMLYKRTSTSIFARKTSNTYMTIATILFTSVCSLHADVMHFRTKPVMPKEAESHTLETPLGSYFKSTSLCPGEIRRDRAHVHGSASEVSIPTKMWGQDGCFYGIAVSLGGSRYRDETRVETLTYIITPSKFCSTFAAKSKTNRL